MNLAEEYALREIKREIDAIKEKRPNGNFCSVLVGRLISEQDKRVISAEEAQNFADSHAIRYFEIATGDKTKID